MEDIDNPEIDVEASYKEGVKALKEAGRLVQKSLEDVTESKKVMDIVIKAMGISKEDLDKQGDESKLSKAEREIFDVAMKEYTAAIHANPESSESKKGENKARPGIRSSGKRLRI